MISIGKENWNKVVGNFGSDEAKIQQNCDLRNVKMQVFDVPLHQIKSIVDNLMTILLFSVFRHAQ